MEEELVSYETAKLAEEKGFVGETMHEKGYRNNGLLYYRTGIDGESLINFETGSQEWDFNREVVLLDAPTQSLLQRWIREKHNMHLNVIYSTNKAIIEDFGKGMFFWSVIEAPELDEKLEFFNSYEEALEVGLYEALKLIK